MRNESIDNIVTDNLHLLQADTTEQQEHSSVQTCREVDKLVRDIQAIKCPDDFDDFVRILIDVLSKRHPVGAITKDHDHYKSLNRSQVYFWDDIVLLQQKSFVCVTRLAQLFRVNETEFDTDKLKYMRKVLDVCHQETTTDWEHINAYLTPKQDGVRCVFPGSAQNTARGIAGARCVYVPGRPRAAPSAYVTFRFAPSVVQVLQTPMYACVPRMS